MATVRSRVESRDQVLMVQPVNPYMVGAPALGEREFFGRKDTLDWVARVLRDRGVNSLVLFGQRGIGKTAFLMQLERVLPADAFLPVYLDLHDQATRALGHVLADLADAVIEQAGLDPPDPEMFDDRGLFFNRTFLPQVYAALGPNRRPVFLLDEFEVLDEATEEALPALAAAQSLLRFFRRVMSKDPRPAFVFAAGRRVEDLTLDFTATFKASSVREIWILDRESAEAVVRQAETNGTLRFTSQAVARVLALTSGHPYVTQLLCHQIWERAYADKPTEPPRIGVQEVEAAVPGAIGAGDHAFGWLWDGLTLHERIYAAGLAEAAREGESIQEHRVMQLLADHAARLRMREVELMASRDLVRRRVLDMTKEREHRFGIELFRLWVRQRKPLEGVKVELEQIDPLAEDLYGIGQEFFRRNQWEAATRYFRDAIATNPHHFRARLRLGETLLQLGRTGEAVAELEWAYEQDRGEARELLTRALVAQAWGREEAGDEEGALAACEQALRVSPGDHTAQRIRGTILVRRLQVEARRLERAGRWTEAISVYEQLMPQAPDEDSHERWRAALERCRKEDRLARLFVEGVGALDRKEWQRAQRALAEVVHGRPDYGRDKQQAAQLLWQAVQGKPARKYRGLLAVAFAVIAVVALAAVFLLRPREETPLEPPVALPENWEHVRTYRLDTNHDNVREWVVLYRFDLSEEIAQDGAPIGGVVYGQADDAPSAFASYALDPQGDEYLCECECAVEMEDVLSQLSGPELVVRDHCGGEVTRVSIFYWNPDRQAYLPQGYFDGSRIEVGRDYVTVDQRLPHRAQLALRQVYRAERGRTYYGPFGQGVLAMPETYELVGYQPEPTDVTLSPYPEKVVLAFYNHYADGEGVADYFTERGWQELDRCTDGKCGCSTPRNGVAHVRVTYLEQAEDAYGEGESPGPDEAAFDLNVICERRGDRPEEETSVRWYLVRQDGRWKLDGAEMMPAGVQDQEED